MNRRKLFSFLAISPVASVAVAKEVMAAPAGEAAQYPLGYMIDAVEPETKISFGPGIHTHSTSQIPPNMHGFTTSYPYTYETVRHRTMVWDGKQFVEFSSPDGAAVMNAVLSKARG